MPLPFAYKDNAFARTIRKKVNFHTASQRAYDAYYRCCNFVNSHIVLIISVQIVFYKKVLCRN